MMMGKNDDPNHKHVVSIYSFRGHEVPYIAHIITVKGARPGEEVVDDVHVELEPVKMPMGILNWVGNDRHKYDSLCKQIAEVALTKYLVDGPTPED